MFWTSGCNLQTHAKPKFTLKTLKNIKITLSWGVSYLNWEGLYPSIYNYRGVKYHCPTHHPLLSLFLNTSMCTSCSRSVAYLPHSNTLSLVSYLTPRLQLTNDMMLYRPSSLLVCSLSYFTCQTTTDNSSLQH